MAHVTVHPPSLPSPPCGFALYRTTPDDPGVLVLITFLDGEHVAAISEDEDEGEVVPVAWMVGEFEPVSRPDRALP
jgi:hypothetical protein